MNKLPYWLESANPNLAKNTKQFSVHFQFLRLIKNIYN